MATHKPLTTPPNILIDQLTRVRSRLIGTGWKQGYFGHPEGPNCLVGAVDYEVTTFTDQGRVTGALLDTLNGDQYHGDLYFSHRSRLINWNDAPGRTIEDVLDLIDRTIARLTTTEGA
jgi:hypothetical protein